MLCTLQQKYQFSTSLLHCTIDFLTSTNKLISISICMIYFYVDFIKKFIARAICYFLHLTTVLMPIQNKFENKLIEKVLKTCPKKLSQNAYNIRQLDKIYNFICNICTCKVKVTHWNSPRTICCFYQIVVNEWGF